MPGAAKSAMRFHGILQDAWVAKGFILNGERASVKVGNQVMNWGESLFFGGGINGVNPIDYQRAATPGTLVKETLLAQPAVSFNSALGNGFSGEAYYQFGYTNSYFPPVGSYWSTGYSLGAGAYNYQSDNITYVPGTAGYYPLNNNVPGQWTQGQFGGALRWQPESTQINVAAYAINYIDKAPQLTVGLADPLNSYAGSTTYNYLKNRQLFGMSMNMPVGDWTLASEVSFRPKDAVTLNAFTSYCGVLDGTGNGNCAVQSQKYQAAMNGAFTMTPSNSGPVLDFLGAQGGNIFLEYTGVYYPQMQQQYAAGTVATGGLYSGFQYGGHTAVPLGTKYSSGGGVDLSVNYDNKIIDGWLVTPEIFYQQAFGGYTPNSSMQFVQGNASASAIVSFARNTGGWAAQLNYTKFLGPNTYQNLYRDRSFLAATASYTF
jgi:hypothetical protein